MANLFNLLGLPDLSQPGGLLGTNPNAPAPGGFGARLGDATVSGDPLLDLGLGLLAASGPSPVPTSFGQALASGVGFARQAELGRLKLQQSRQRLQALEEQRRQTSALADLLGEQTTVTAPSPFLSESARLAAQAEGLDPSLTAQVPTISTPTGQNRLLQAAARLDPGSAINSLLADDDEPNVIQTLRAAGIDPQSEQGQELIRRNVAGDDVSALMAQLQTQQTLLDIERRRDELRTRREERQDKAETERLERTDVQNAINTDVARGLEAARLNEQLVGTPVQTGPAFSARRQAIGAAGLLSDDQRQLAAKAARFEQLSTQFGVRMLEVLKGTGTISNAKFNTLLENTISPNAEPEANRKALADIFQLTLEAADKEKVVISPELRKQVEALIPKLRSGKSALRQDDDVLSRLAGVDKLSPEERAELRERLEMEARRGN